MRILDDNDKMYVKETTFFLDLILHYRRGEAGFFENTMILF